MKNKKKTVLLSALCGAFALTAAFGGALVLQKDSTTAAAETAEIVAGQIEENYTYGTMFDLPDSVQITVGDQEYTAEKGYIVYPDGYAYSGAENYELNKIGEYNYLGTKKYWTNGYGYVGVNPKYVPDIEVRQAIMKSMETALIVKNYYTTSLAKTIYRSMSTESWAYPTDSEGNPVTQHEKVAFTREKKTIEELVYSAGWRKGTDGVYAKDGQRLKFTFTIAGETTDHPAYSMFQEAATFLNSCGFEITVTTDISALKKLATGDLQVWAAAWSSSIDPDLYQVYHKDSTATSVKNWGYPTIMNGSVSQFGYEQEVIEELSALIEKGRETLNQGERKTTYAQALDKIMELCVELPTYQRQDLVVYNRSVIDTKTLNEDPSSTSGVFDRLWEVNYHKA